jgi:hypothetical protein
MGSWPGAPYPVTQRANVMAVPRPYGMAVASLVLGITSIVFCWSGIFAALQIVLAIVFGCIALSRTERGGGPAPHAIPGIICACGGLLLYLILGVATGGLLLVI